MHPAYAKLSRLLVLKMVLCSCLRSFPSPNRNLPVSSLTCCVRSRAQCLGPSTGRDPHLCWCRSLRGWSRDGQCTGAFLENSFNPLKNQP